MRITYECEHCNGLGEIDTHVCISEWTPPAKHDDHDELAAIVADAKKAKADHYKLCAINPRDALSYHHQLSTVLAELERRAGELMGQKS